MTDRIQLVVHGPPGSAPPVLAEAFRSGFEEAGVDGRTIELLDRGNDPGIDAMDTLEQHRGSADMLSTCTPVFMQAPLLRGQARTYRDFTPIARLVADRFLVVVRSDADWAPDAAGFLRTLASKPTRTAGYFKGGINHLLALAIADATKGEVAFKVVPNEPAVWSELGQGTIDWGCGVMAELQPHLTAGRLRVIAVLDDRRLARRPDLPTLAEAGAPVVFKLWRGLLAPAGLSEAQQSRWHDIVARVVETEAWKAYLVRNNQDSAYLPGAAFTAFLDEEWRWYEKHLGLAGLLPAAQG